MTLFTSLATLETSGLIRLAQMDPELEYLFRHALVQEATYETILKADRKRLHFLVGETLEQMFPDHVSELAPLLGHHFLEAKDKTRALKYFTLAGKTSLANYANSEAENHFRTALSLTQDVGILTQLLSGLGEALFRQSQFKKADSVWLDAVTAYQELRDFDRMAYMYARRIRAIGIGGMGDLPGALTLSQHGLKEMEGQPESSGLAALFHEAGRACHFSQLPDEALLYCQTALAIAEHLNDVETQAETLATLWGLLPVQSIDEAIKHLQRACTLAESVGRLHTAARIYMNLGGRLWFEEGRAHYWRSVEISRKIGSEASQFSALGGVINISFSLGELENVEKVLITMNALLPSVGNYTQSLLYLDEWKARLLHFRGEWDGAIMLYQSVRTGFLQLQAFDDLAETNGAFAELLLELNHLTLAEEVLREFQQRVNSESSMDYLHSHLVVWHARKGQIEEAHQFLTRLLNQGFVQVPGMRYFIPLTDGRVAMCEQKWSYAIEAFKTASDLCARHHIRWYHAQILREWADAHLSRNEPGDIDRARELLQDSLAGFEAMKIPKYAALVQEKLQSLSSP